MASTPVRNLHQGLTDVFQMMSHRKFPEMSHDTFQKRVASRHLSQAWHPATVPRHVVLMQLFSLNHNNNRSGSIRSSACNAPFLPFTALLPGRWCFCTAGLHNHVPPPLISCNVPVVYPTHSRGSADDTAWLLQSNFSGPHNQPWLVYPKLKV